MYVYSKKIFQGNTIKMSYKTTKNFFFFFNANESI